ncbi:hypothetical protein CcI156_20170 [Frankia sp. CcI156]|jgi:uncharacterized protein YndB with AHSA1/START domain|uniref:Uncharacterized protein n=1 Tax=Frankia casuarinae (strain DSM 45818 / CECT 9043 / HFP020203 / CcI3) TaxID=106370 RepID=Q2J7X4_FRACC|nr:MULTISPECIES: SRPBCC family protein [Frankia]ABD12618.1 hypothetical protein Francci3_3261 [Frankia casuarinae]ESZ99965.1 hypothetical protein CcI6DRAFT_04625 [Frankia sp. CcI6]EYT90847.1 hypothetical protein ThrDRAFT_03495 [Frankia casuarinae]KDA41867.1 hypothetical protein BMG523Draft_03338 [Frankia sp. BMG5.23]OAA19949.1 Polyketide cyclase / dehydrase and lipid transport [Frankia casuarinae]
MTSNLLYRGPGIAELHEEYAKKRVLDEKAPVKAAAEISVAAPTEKVWRLISEIDRWPAWNPAVRDVQVHGGVAVDTSFIWVNGKSRVRSTLAVVDPLHEITWSGVSAGIKAVHRNVLERTPDGTVRVTSMESMSMPFLGLIFSSTKLRSGLNDWLTALRQAAEKA